MVVLDTPTAPVRSASAWPTSLVALAFLLLAVVMTWPLAAVLSREIAGDLGDPLFNAWVLHWTGGQLLHAIAGHVAELGRYWHGNIFYPTKYVIARSEHLAPETLQALPVLALTHNVVLAYNLLLLSSIVLGGLGTYLFVLDLTDSSLGAFLAGVAFAFAPFRLDQWAHLDVLASQWMPFALLGFRRFVVTGRARALAAGTAALVAQALSCLYYLAYFTPFAALYVVYEMAAQRRLRDARLWRGLAGAAAAALLVMGVFLWPYVVVRGGAEHEKRDISEVQEFSADTHGFATISSRSRLWGTRIRALPRNENQGFPGFTILLFAGLGAGIACGRAIRSFSGPATVRWRWAIAWVMALVLAVHVALILHLFATGIGTVSVLGVVLRLRYRPMRIVTQTLALVAGLLLASPRARHALRVFWRVPAAFFAGAVIIAALLALGPTMFAAGHPLGPGPYGLLYRYVPGFEAFRVVSLYFMPISLFLAVLAGLGAAAIGTRRVAQGVVAVAVLAILGESWSVPVETNAPPQVVVSGLRAEPAGVYRWIRDLPGSPVIVELPMGETFVHEAGYIFAAGYHRKPLVNGYSGFIPAEYLELIGRLRTPTPDAWSALRRSGATHVVVHESAYEHAGEGARTSQWLRRSGAVETAAFGADRVFQLP